MAAPRVIQETGAFAYEPPEFSRAERLGMRGWERYGIHSVHEFLSAVQPAGCGEIRRYTGDANLDGVPDRRIQGDWSAD